jgi:hypothetical protein
MYGIPAEWRVLIAGNRECAEGLAAASSSFSPAGGLTADPSDTRFDGAQFDNSVKFGHAHAVIAGQHAWPGGWCLEPSPTDAYLSRIIHDAKP